MSLMQEFQKARKIIEEDRSSALDKYCEMTGADIGKVMFTIEGWDQFMEWLESREK